MIVLVSVHLWWLKMELGVQLVLLHYLMSTNQLYTITGPDTGRSTVNDDDDNPAGDNDKSAGDNNNSVGDNDNPAATIVAIVLFLLLILVAVVTVILVIKFLELYNSQMKQAKASESNEHLSSLN